MNCPECKSPLEAVNEMLCCPSCGHYEFTENRKSKIIKIEVKSFKQYKNEVAKTTAMQAPKTNI